MHYELYSWQDSKSGEWKFSLQYNTNRNKTVKEVFNKKTSLKGVGQLKERISEMAKGSHIVWFDRLTVNGERAKGSEKLKYPPDEIVSKVREYAGALGVEVVGPPMNPGKP